MLFRPLRLFLSGVELRQARIVLLRATHWPYVAAIYAFEGVKHSLGRSQDEEGLFATRARSYRRPLLAGRGNSIPKASRNLRVSWSKNRSQASLPMKAGATGDRPSHMDANESMAELRQMKAVMEKLNMQETLDSRLRTQELMIAKLSAQVEELARRLAKPEDGRVD